MKTESIAGRGHYRAVFISDVHLGHRGCRADHLHRFLGSLRCERLYLLGDIIDCQALRRGIYWPDGHQRILQSFLDLARSGTRVVYVPGNHDEELRRFCGHQLAGIEVHRRFRHRTLAGDELLLAHGDDFDTDIETGRLLRWIGHNGAEWLIHLNRWVNGLSRLSGGRYLQVSNAVKQRIRRIAQHIEAFAGQACAAAAREGCSGVVAGHIHFPSLGVRGDVLYANCGDWVESCTTLVETRAGDLRLMHWSDHLRTIAVHPAGRQRRRRMAA